MRVTQTLNLSSLQLRPNENKTWIVRRVLTRFVIIEIDNRLKLDGFMQRHRLAHSTATRGNVHCDPLSTSNEHQRKNRLVTSQSVNRSIAVPSFGKNLHRNSYGITYSPCTHNDTAGSNTKCKHVTPPVRGAPPVRTSISLSVGQKKRNSEICYMDQTDDRCTLALKHTASITAGLLVESGSWWLTKTFDGCWTSITSAKFLCNWSSAFVLYAFVFSSIRHVEDPRYIIS